MMYLNTPPSPYFSHYRAISESKRVLLWGFDKNTMKPGHRCVSSKVEYNVQCTLYSLLEYIIVPYLGTIPLRSFLF
jgi:hypothetical protein